MKKLFVMLMIVSLGIIAPVQKANANDPVTIVIKEGVKKAIRAVDLKIQRLQIRTIRLQNTAKMVENTMTKRKLDEISDWVDRQKDLYKDYFDELRKVKSILLCYHRTQEVFQQQISLVEEYKRAYKLIKQDAHFTGEEMRYMEEVYRGIIDESVRQLDQVGLVIQSFTTQMSDASRLEIINAASDALQRNYDDLRTFNGQNALLSLSRAKDAHDIEVTKKLYGIQ